MNTKVFMSGLLNKICTYLDLEGHTPIIERDTPEYPKSELDLPFIIPKPEQSIAVDAILKHKRGIIQAPVRFGKTIIAAELARMTSLFPYLFIGQQLDPISQAMDKFKRSLPNYISFGLCGDGKVEVGDITVSTIQTLAHAHNMMINRKGLKDAGISKVEKAPDTEDKKKLRDLVHDAKIVVVDEVHHAVSRIHQEILKKASSAEIIMGLSATVPESLKLERAIGPVVYYISFSEAAKKGYILPTRIYLYRYAITPELKKFCKTSSYPEIYNKCITENEFRNQLICKIALKAVEQGKTVVISVRYVSHGRALEAIIPNSIFMYGKDDMELRSKIIDSLSKREFNLVISTLLKEAVDIPSLDMVINADCGESDIKTIQQLRSITPDGTKTVGMLVDFFDDVKYLRRHCKSRIAQYKEKGFEIIERKV